MSFNKRKIINDPVHGFIKIGDDLIFDIIEHPYFQRLRRIRQMGLSEFVYPGSLHTRFNHALGAMHLMGLALDTLRDKGVTIRDEEYRSTLIAILLHDIGHGPMSHALEKVILKSIPHERLSGLFMRALNENFEGKLDMAIRIFENKYPRKFLHQLVSSQLDMDRLDYLLRDSFFTGVVEGKIGSDRIIKMLFVKEDELVVEEKGIYSIENFLTARRLMYWQVYLHKTNLCTEQMLIQLIKRAKKLLRIGSDVFIPPNLAQLLKEDLRPDDFLKKPAYLKAFGSLDDYDIWWALKQWEEESDVVLRTLSKMLLNRDLFKVSITNEPPDLSHLEELREKVSQYLNLKEEEVSHFVIHGSLSNEAYLDRDNNRINILTKKGEVKDIAQASDLPNIKALRQLVKKYYVCWFKV